MRFESYVQAIYKNYQIHTTTSRTLGVIYLQELDTSQGGFEVVNLLTINIIYIRKFIIIQITQEVINRFEVLSKKCGIKSLLRFKNHKEGKFTIMMMKIMSTMIKSQ